HRLFSSFFCVFFFQAEDGIRDATVTGVQTCALPISTIGIRAPHRSCAPVQAICGPRRCRFLRDSINTLLSWTAPVGCPTRPPRRSTTASVVVTACSLCEDALPRDSLARSCRCPPPPSRRATAIHRPHRVRRGESWRCRRGAWTARGSRDRESNRRKREGHSGRARDDGAAC